MTSTVKGSGTSDDPWILQTPSLQGEFQMVRDPDADPPALVCTVGSTELRYHLRAIEDLHTMLVERGDWVPLGSADEQKPAKEGTVEAWARDPRQSGRRVVRTQEGPARSIRELRATGARGDGARRSGAQRPQQPHAIALIHTVGWLWGRPP